LNSKRGGNAAFFVMPRTRNKPVAVIAVPLGGACAEWRSRVSYPLKAAALAAGTLLIMPYLFLYDMVLANALAFLVRIGLNPGFQCYELPALGLVAALLLFYPLVGAPTGFVATLIVSGLIAGRCGFRRGTGASPTSPNAGRVALRTQVTRLDRYSANQGILSEELIRP
jgi:hypothetical protein